MQGLKMELMTLNINKSLLLDEYIFQRPDNSIDFLNKQAQFASDAAAQLSFLSKASKLAEKFHSFFHFEQSYFHTQLAVMYTDCGKKEEAHEQLQLAVFQDHINTQAKSMLAQTMPIDICRRPYNSFSEYLNFATGEKRESPNKGYWCLGFSTIMELHQIIEGVKFQHLLYHEEAAKIYLNRALVFSALRERDLAKNDLMKAFNLDNKLKPYAKAFLSDLVD